MNKDREKTSPEQKTAEFFSQSPRIIADALVQEEGIVITAGERRMRVIEAESFDKRAVGARYRAMQGMAPGDIWSPATRAIGQSLIVARDRDGVGACVRLKRVEYYDEQTGAFVSSLQLGKDEFRAREGDIARYLGLGKHERARLRFKDNSNVLHLDKYK